MSVTIQYEVQLLAGSLALGICLMIIYDGLRLFRLMIPHGNLWTGVEDGLYWIGSSIVTFLLLFEQNDGVLRSYAIIGVLSGMLIYNLSVSRILRSLLKKVLKYFTIKRTRRMSKRQKKKLSSRKETDRKETGWMK